MSENIISIVNLHKSFADVHAVNGISFDVREGELFAFLGLNGAGKSTTINIICSILKKDEGKVYIDGMDIDKESRAIKSLMGIVFQNSVLDPLLSVKDNLSARAALYGIYGKCFNDKLAELSNELDLQPILKRPYGKLSGGQKRRADIARGLINSPKILILDEPTTGLDPQTRKQVWNVLESWRKKYNMTVFLTTHYMEEANNADNVVIIDGGKIVARGSPNDLKNRYSGTYLKIYSQARSDIENSLACDNIQYDYNGDCYVCRMQNPDKAGEFMRKYPDFTRDFEVIKGDMDDVFLNVTGKSLAGGGLDG